VPICAHCVDETDAVSVRLGLLCST